MVSWIVGLAGALGADLVVGGPFADFSDVDDAVANANNGDRILLAPGTYRGSFTINNERITIESLEPQAAVLEPTTNLGFEIQGGNAEVEFRNVVIDGRNQFPAITMTDGAMVELRHVRIEDIERDSMNNRDGGAIRATGNNSTLIIEDSEFSNGRAGDDGGFIAMGNNTSLTVDRTSFIGGEASDDGGAIYCTASNRCVFTEVFFDDNMTTAMNGSPAGGALWATAVDDLEVVRSVLCRSSSQVGGAIFASNSELVLRNSLLDANQATNQGGALYIVQDPKAATADPPAIRSFQNVYRGNTGELGGAGFITGDAFWQGHGDIYLSNRSTTPDMDEQDILRGEGDATALIDYNLYFDISGPSFTTFPDKGDNYVRNLLEDVDPRFANSTVCDPLSVELQAQSPAIDVYNRAENYPNGSGTVFPNSQLDEPDGSDADLGAWGAASQWTDDDSDGFVGGIQDCDDGDGAIRPTGTEVVGNGTDENCDGGDRCHIDADGDGFGAVTGFVNSGNLECTDVGEAGLNNLGDCVDFDDAINPDAPDICNGIDDNCDGEGGPDDSFDDDDISWAEELSQGADDCSNDSDGDGVPDIVEWDEMDTDGDSLWDIVDLDDDGDGISTLEEGTGEAEEHPSCVKLGIVPDGIENYLDLDSDGDGRRDSDEAGDFDGDGVIDSLICQPCKDPGDDDNDDICNSIEADLMTDPLNPDTDGDGVPDGIEYNGVILVDADGDGIINPLDPDDDGDGIPTSVEAPNGDFERDRDGDGIFDYLDREDWDGADFDRDGDGLTNFEEELVMTDPADVDTDNDGFTDGFEVGNPLKPRDTDNDGIIDALDEDDDGDTIPTVVEGPFDTDGDGVLDPYDVDSDDDGVPDGSEPDADADCDGIIDRLDNTDDAACEPLPPLPTYERMSCSTSPASSGLWLPFWLGALLVARRRSSCRSQDASARSSEFSI